MFAAQFYISENGTLETAVRALNPIYLHIHSTAHKMVNTEPSG
jgi:hypothetical protein